MATGPVNWIVGLCSVVFDVDVGQKVQHCVPEGILSEEEKSDVGFHAFPDSMSLELQGRSAIRDSSFMMRIRRRGVRAPLPASSTSTSPPSAGASTPAAAAPLQQLGRQGSEPREPSYLYGFVFCRQRQDESLRRGGEQISVVLLSEHPLSAVLRPLSQIAGPMYFSSGLAALEQVHQEVAAWPAPVSGPLLQLQVGFSSLSCRLPSFHTLPGPSNALCCDQVAGLYARPSLRLNGSGDQLAARASTAHAQTAVGLFARPYVRSGSDGAVTSTLDAAVAASVAAAAAAAAAGASSNGDSSTTLPTPRSNGDVPPSPRTAAASHPLSHQPSHPLSLDPAPSMASTSSAEGEPPPLAPQATVQRTSSTGLSRRMSFQALESQAATGAFYEVDIFTPLQAQLHRLWHLWELVLCAKPLMVVAPTPGDTSNTLAALIALIAPVPYSADFRPYYTIQDSAFSRLASGEMPDQTPESVPTMMGVTNLFFVRALPNWPSVLSVGKKEAPATQWGTPGAAAAAATTSTLLPAMASVLNPGNAVKALRLRASGAQALLGGHTENLWSVYKPLCRQDQVLLLRLLQARATDVKSKAARVALVNSEAIRRHFYDLTAAFLTPFSKYFEPGPSGTVPVWAPEAFLLERRAASNAPLLLDRMGSVANLVELYARFTSSVNFARWFHLRRAPVLHLEERQPEPAEEPSPDGLAVFKLAVLHMEEVELIQMFFSVEQQLQDVAGEADSPDAAPEVKDMVARLRRELLVLFIGMPEDLQQTCVSSPARCDLLLSLGLTGDQHTRLAQLVAQLRAGAQM